MNRAAWYTLKALSGREPSAASASRPAMSPTELSSSIGARESDATHRATLSLVPSERLDLDALALLTLAARLENLEAVVVAQAKKIRELSHMVTS